MQANVPNKPKEESLNLLQTYLQMWPSTGKGPIRTKKYFPGFLYESVAEILQHTMTQFFFT